MNPYTFAQTIILGGLDTLSHLLDKADQHVRERGMDEAQLLTASLAPDMFNFTKQIQVATDDARRNLRLLAGKEHIRMEDTETSIQELRERILKTKEIVTELTEEDFSGADTRHISLYWMGEQYVEGSDFIKEFVTQNFLFHVAMAYAILRKEGVIIGKQDYIRALNMKQ